MARSSRSTLLAATALLLLPLLAPAGGLNPYLKYLGAYGAESATNLDGVATCEFCAHAAAATPCRPWQPCSRSSTTCL